MVSAIYHHLRNNHPIAYFALLMIAVTIIVSQALAFIANNTALLDTLGATTLKSKIIAAKETTYWHIRAWQHNDVDSPLIPERHYGFLQSVNHDGTINVTMIKDNQYQTERIALADTIIRNPHALALVVEMHKHENAEFELYSIGQQYPYTIVWLEGEPFNLQIIKAGIADPDTTPPTNIVDRLFAEYYWKQLTQ